MEKKRHWAIFNPLRDIGRVRNKTNNNNVNK